MPQLSDIHLVYLKAEFTTHPAGGACMQMCMSQWSCKRQGRRLRGIQKPRQLLHLSESPWCAAAVAFPTHFQMSQQKLAQLNDFNNARHRVCISHNEVRNFASVQKTQATVGILFLEMCRVLIIVFQSFILLYSVNRNYSMHTQTSYVDNAVCSGIMGR